MDNRQTIGEKWRNKAQELFSDMNSPQLINPELSLWEKQDLWKQFTKEIKTNLNSSDADVKATYQNAYKITMK